MFYFKRQHLAENKKRYLLVYENINFIRKKTASAYASKALCCLPLPFLPLFPLSTLLLLVLRTSGGVRPRVGGLVVVEPRGLRHRPRRADPLHRPHLRQDGVLIELQVRRQERDRDLLVVVVVVVVVMAAMVLVVLVILTIWCRDVHGVSRMSIDPRTPSMRV